MNNEPIAWIIQSGYGKPTIVKNPLHQFNYQAESAKWDDVPLYTHPAKTLTDEEILEELLIPKSEWDSYKAHHCLKQIRAILKKASEK